MCSGWLARRRAGRGCRRTPRTNPSGGRRSWPLCLLQRSFFFAVCTVLTRALSPQHTPSDKVRAPTTYPPLFADKAAPPVWTIGEKA